ncbi:MAG: YIP1 family protein, partial [Sphingomonadales bacterium]
MEATSKRLQAGEAQPAVAPTALQALLPESLGPYRRVEVSNSGVGAGGVGGSTAEGRYENGGSSFALTLSDISAAGALAAMGSALNVQSSRQTATGYERTGNVEGRMTTEKWDMNSKQGEYGVLVADRFMVQASGTVPSMDVLKGAVNAVGLSKLESMKG